MIAEILSTLNNKLEKTLHAHDPKITVLGHLIFPNTAFGRLENLTTLHNHHSRPVSKVLTPSTFSLVRKNSILVVCNVPRGALSFAPI
mmetsp:Transcript_5556/g.11192  ORF Transcript_5556/g.11192 Transcript_5556/m.11192 type:complete len:88 (-) Transcript_5556:115-378(-)